MAIMGGAVARESLALRAWTATCLYVIIYGAAFLFMVGPATQALAGLGDPSLHRFTVFGLWLTTAVILTVGALLMSYTIDMMMDRRYLENESPAWRVETAFAVRGVIFALMAAGLFVTLGALVVGTVTAPLMWAALWAFVVPGLVAGVSTRMVMPSVLAERKQIVPVSAFALAVVVLSNYVMVGAVEPLQVLAGA